MTLAAEMKHIERDMRYMLGSGGQYGIETEYPLRVHARDFDSGGAPEWHASFERFLLESGVCFCPEPTRDDPRGHRYPCSNVKARLRNPTNHAHPRRLKRAFRQLRDLNPAAYDVMWLLIGRHMPWVDVCAKINDERERRGQNRHEDHEMTVLYISGAAMLWSAF